MYRIAAKFLLAAWTLIVAAVPTAEGAAALDADPDALARAMAGHRVVLLGEVHDNGVQHRLREKALRAAIEKGARPAIAFEQFDRERQPDIDRARRERPGDADHVIAQGQGAPSWHWEFYRPYVQLALDYDLPIVAANLSRGEAMKTAMGGASATPAGARKPPESFLRLHESVIAKGHCDLLPADALPGMARAQIARDRVLAESIRPHVQRGVVLLTGNGHARIDIGVPFWLTADERAASVSIGVLERGDEDATGEPAVPFDVYVITERAERADPCVELRQRMGK